MTYGGLEAMIILVLWTFYSACIVLFLRGSGFRLPAAGCYIAGQAFV